MDQKETCDRFRAYRYQTPQPFVFNVGSDTELLANIQLTEYSFTTQRNKRIGDFLHNIPYEEHIIARKDVFVNNMVSKVPSVFASLTCLLKTFKEENIKSTDTILRNAFK